VCDLLRRDDTGGFCSSPNRVKQTMSCKAERMTFVEKLLRKAPTHDHGTAAREVAVAATFLLANRT
jgi:hypothetical protein